MQQAGLGHFHPPGFPGAVVVVAVQMQGTMDDQVRKVVRGTTTSFVCLAPHDAKR